MALPTSVKNGTGFPQMQPARMGRTESGTYTDIPWETTNKTQAARFVLMCEIAGLLFDYEETFGKYRITVHYPYNINNNPATEPPVDLWELNKSKAQKSVLDSNNPLANACSQGELYLLGLFQQNMSDYIITLNTGGTPDYQTGTIAYPETVVTANNVLPAKTLSIGVGSPARTLANLVSMGAQSFDVFVPELKHTRTVNSAYPIQIDLTDVGQIISTSTLYSLESIPNNVLFKLPNLLNPAPGNGKPVLNYGWYKNAPQVNQIARQKFQISETWEYGLWSVDLYGAPL